MDAALSASPVPSTTSSDDDAYNTESARLHFGPLKTPERKFMAQRPSLFPLHQTPPPRRSPRLSSPRLQLTFLQETNGCEEEDIDDDEQVEQLMNESDEDDVSSDSSAGTPENGNFLLDEPSSALAERISMATDNPSPPPSPILMRQSVKHIFPTATTPDMGSSGETINVLVPFPLDKLVVGDLPSSSRRGSSPSGRVTLSDASPPGNTSSQMDLITFDSFSMPTSAPTQTDTIIADSFIIPNPNMESVDALLSSSPAAATRLSPPLASLPVPPIIIVQSPSQTCELEVVAKDDMDIEMVESEAVLIIPSLILETTLPSTPPLRRSPRRSISPNPPQIEAAGPSAAPSSPQRKEKNGVFVADSEIVNDSQDEKDINQVSPTRLVSTTNAITPITTPRRMDRRGSRSPLQFSREVGSLSPTSADLLTKLVPSFTDNTPLQFDRETMPSRTVITSPSRAMQSFSAFQTSSRTLPSTPTPVRIVAMPSSSKFRIQVTSPNDLAPSNTPARRIPMEQAIDKGQLSPQKAAQLGYSASRTPNLGAPQTPARRVLISQQTDSTPSSARLGLRFGSPTRATSKEREISDASPTHEIVETRKEKSIVPQSRTTKDKANYAAGPSSLGGRINKLPFPLVASGKPPVISSSKGKELAQDKQPLLFSSPIRSTLKQPTSRIPRIGNKPYARPDPPKPAAPKPAITTMRMVDLSKLSGSSGRMASKVACSGNESLTKGRETAVRPVIPPSQIKTNDDAASNALKRKRATEKSSPPKSRMVILRQVPQVVISKVVPIASGRTGTSTITEAKKPAGMLRLRRVIDEPMPVPQHSSHPVQMSSSPPRPESGDKVMQLDDQPTELPSSPMQQDSLDGKIQPPQDTPPIETLPAVEESTSAVRRTTRIRKTAGQIDVFTESSIRSTQSRRKTISQGYRYTDAYSEMSATALKALTTSNTERNQRYLSANLETEVIRKEGVRPESPAVKIKTIAQRMEENKSKQREERAQRRARRGDSDFTGSSDVDGLSDDGYSSPIEVDMEDSTPTRHRRGAGEEEDYETPDRGLKRVRLTESGFQEVEEASKRRVKWDRGLYTTVFLDEVKLGTRQPMKENRQTKGCLASTAKATRLDTLGNLPNADSPLTDIVPQNVTVKKFIYDNEIEPIPEIIVVKNTRSKSKKAKS